MHSARSTDSVHPRYIQAIFMNTTGTNVAYILYVYLFIYYLFIYLCIYFLGHIYPKHEETVTFP